MAEGPPRAAEERPVDGLADAPVVDVPALLRRWEHAWSGDLGGKAFWLGTLLGLPFGAAAVVFLPAAPRALPDPFEGIRGFVTHALYGGGAPTVRSLLFGPLAETQGRRWAALVSAISAVVLSGLIAFAARRITGTAMASLLAPLAFWSFELQGGFPERLPHFFPMLMLGVLGVLLAWRATTPQRRSRARAMVGAGACLAASAHFDPLGLVFLFGTPILVVASGPRRPAGAAVTVVASAILLLVVMNPLAGALGAGGSPASPSAWNAGHLGELGTALASGLGGTGVVAIVAGIASLPFLSGRELRALSIAGGFALLGLFVIVAEALPRHAALLLPGFALLTGVGVSRLVTRGGIPEGIGLALGGAIILASLVSLETMLR